VLPDGRVLVGSRVIGSNVEDPDIFALGLETGETRVIDKGRDPAYAASGHLLWLNSQDQLMAARMDPGTLETSGPAFPVAEDVLRFSISNAGDLLYQSGTRLRVTSEVIWVDRDGTEEVIDWPFEPGTLPAYPLLSPDGTKLALAVPHQDTFRLFVRDLPNGPNTPLTSGESNQTYPGWTRDGRGIGFLAIGEDGLARLFRARVDGSAPPVPISRPFESNADSVTLGFRSPDQATVLVGDVRGLAALRPGPDAELERIWDAGERCWTPTLSPDGKWVAYSSRVEGQSRVFVRPYPDVGAGRIAISDGEAFQPRWTSDGSRIFYMHVEPGRMEVWSVRVSTDAGFRVDSREALFNAARNVTVKTAWMWLHDADAAGDRFIVSRVNLQPPTSTGLVLVENFFTLLEERAGGH
jgi:hypothetical protein